MVVVQERPSIRTFEVKGNKEIKTEDLEKSLRNIGLARGKILNRSTLEDMRQYLIEQYFSRGRYDVRVEARVEESADNLVDVPSTSPKGKFARIREINVVGNEHFTRQGAAAALELRPSNLLSFYKADDRYSRELLRRRPREAPLLLHGSRLRELRDHLDAGVARARERRPLHHGERVRGRDAAKWAR